MSRRAWRGDAGRFDHNQMPFLWLFSYGGGDIVTRRAERCTHTPRIWLRLCGTVTSSRSSPSVSRRSLRHSSSLMKEMMKARQSDYPASGSRVSAGRCIRHTTQPDRRNDDLIRAFNEELLAPRGLRATRGRSIGTRVLLVDSVSLDRTSNIVAAAWQSGHVSLGRFTFGHTLNDLFRRHEALHLSSAHAIPSDDRAREASPRFASPKRRWCLEGNAVTVSNF